MSKRKVLVSLITEDNDFQVEQAASAQAAAAILNASVEIIYANNDAVLQTQQILQFIQEPAKRPDAILVEPIGTGMRRVAKAAVETGIAWGVINAGVDYLAELRLGATVPVFSLLSDHEEIGRIQGRQIAAILGETGSVLCIEGPGGRDVARLRSKGMMALKPNGVGVKSLKGDWTLRSGHHALKSWLALSTSRQMKIGMIVCQNDDMAVGARRAFEELTDMQERDAWLRLPITGCDGVPKAGQNWVREGRLTATVLSPPLMGEAMELFAKARNSGVQPPERTLATPSSFPKLSELKQVRAAST
jgi:ABC-type sugar transport system substrate-binding protein